MSTLITKIGTNAIHLKLENFTTHGGHVFWDIALLPQSWYSRR